jgi:hypothetical protein
MIPTMDITFHIPNILQIHPKKCLVLAVRILEMLHQPVIYLHLLYLPLFTLTFNLIKGWFVLVNDAIHNFVGKYSIILWIFEKTLTLN